jgi:uncharacterized coiled-coil protein SlyX
MTSEEQIGMLLQRVEKLEREAAETNISLWNLNSAITNLNVSTENIANILVMHIKMFSLIKQTISDIVTRINL